MRMPTGENQREAEEGGEEGQLNRAGRTLGSNEWRSVSLCLTTALMMEGA